MKAKAISKELDQFYTNPEIARECMGLLKKEIELNQFDILLEPSAGEGVFLKLLDPKKRIGLDLDPKDPEIIKQNFFTYNPDRSKKILTIGNPPFGKRSKLSIDFFNHAASFSEVIAFIIPLQWRKWSVQSKLAQGWRLIKDHTLKEKAFIHEGKPYGVRCCFQIWVKGDGPSLRMSEKLPTDHPDFHMYLYNNTRQAEKYFDMDWDFAVPRQGYADYERRETDKDKCEKTTQWIFFKAKNKTVRKRLMNIDYEKLAMKNTSTPGWGKADVVELYSTLYAKK